MNTESSKENAYLEQQIKNLQTTLNNIGTYVFTKDLSGKYTYVNELVRELFDCPMDEIIGFDDSKFFELSLSNDIKINDQKVMLDDVTIDEEEKNIIAKTGEVKYYQTVKKPLYDLNNNIIGMFGVSTDVTKHKEMEFELKRKEELLNTVLNNVDAFIYMKDKDYKYLYLNPKTANLFGMKPDDIIGKTEEDFLPQEDAAPFRKMDEKVFETGDRQSGEEHLTTLDGEIHNYWSTKVPIKDSDGEIRSYIGISSDITQLSTTDALTGINNRRTLDIEINKIYTQYKRYKHDYCIIMADIDHFKKINDTYGHSEGDKALQVVAKTLQNTLRKTDIIGRWGGEEFLIICNDTKLENIKYLAQKIRKEIEQLSLDIEHKLTISLGVSLIQENDLDPYDIVNRADQLMYKAKKNGRNQVVSDE